MNGLKKWIKAGAVAVKSCEYYIATSCLGDNERLCRDHLYPMQTSSSTLVLYFIFHQHIFTIQSSARCCFVQEKPEHKQIKRYWTIPLLIPFCLSNEQFISKSVRSGHAVEKGERVFGYKTVIKKYCCVNSITAGVKNKWVWVFIY